MHHAQTRIRPDRPTPLKGAESFQLFIGPTNFMQCAFYAAASSAAIIPSLTYHGSVRFFVSLDGVQRNVIRYLHLFHTLQPTLLQPIYPRRSAELQGYNIYLDSTYHADTACHMTPDLCQFRTFQHSKSGCYLHNDFRVSLASLSGVASLRTRLETKHSQDVSQDSTFGSEEETRIPKMRTRCEHFVDQDYAAWRGGFVKSKLEFGICNNDTSLSGVSVGFLVQF